MSLSLPKKFLFTCIVLMLAFVLMEVVARVFYTFRVGPSVLTYGLIRDDIGLQGHPFRENQRQHVIRAEVGMPKLMTSKARLGHFLLRKCSRSYGYVSSSRAWSPKVDDLPRVMTRMTPGFFSSENSFPRKPRLLIVTR